MTTDTFVRALTGDAGQQRVSLSREYRATPDEVWHAITTPERIARVLGPITDRMPTAPGDVFHVDIGSGRVRRAELVACDAPRSLAYVWWSGDDDPGSVRIRLEPTEVGTRVSITHDRLRPHWTTGYGAGWEASLIALAEVLGAPSADVAAAARWELLVRRPLELAFRVDAPRERVWAAWTTQAGLAQWWWSHWSGVGITADVRVGGAYRFAAAAQGMTVAGEYLVVDPRDRLAFTWVWTDDDGVSVDEAVDVAFADAGAGTTITVRHTGPWSTDEPVESYREGWSFVLAALARALD